METVGTVQETVGKVEYNRRNPLTWIVWIVDKRAFMDAKVSKSVRLLGKSSKNF